MSIDRSWRAVFRPWETDAYFTASRPGPDDATDLDVAWWCAEISRLAYQSAPDRRAAALAPTPLTEVARLEAGSTHALVLDSEQQRFVAFRGTSEPDDWKTNLDGLHGDWDEGGRVHNGFRAALDRIWPELAPLVASHRRPVLFTGHSLGGALATLAVALRPPRVAVTFGAPRVGTRGFVDTISRTPIHRFVNGADMVPSLPPSAAGYKHAGALRYIDGDGRLHDHPPRTSVYATRLEAVLQLENPLDEAPAHLADHAPIAYAERLRELTG